MHAMVFIRIETNREAWHRMSEPEQEFSLFLLNIVGIQLLNATSFALGDSILAVLSWSIW
jgi:hypothetical protein